MPKHDPRIAAARLGGRALLAKELADHKSALERLATETTHRQAMVADLEARIAGIDEAQTHDGNAPTIPASPEAPAAAPEPTPEP